MGGDGLTADRNVPVFGARRDAGDEGAAGRLALFRRGEHDGQPHILPELVPLAEEGADIGPLPGYRVPAAWAGAYEHEAAYQVRVGAIAAREAGMASLLLVQTAAFRWLRGRRRR